MSCASTGYITKLKQSIFVPFDIYGWVPAEPEILWGVLHQSTIQAQ
jgi:hypothetical protein